MHSILITHRNRHEHLAVCLWSIRRSAWLRGVTDYEVVIVDNGSDYLPETASPRERLIVDQSHMPVFCKSRLYNVAIDMARGDVLTFLDADAVVGSRWMRGVDVLQDASIIRLCYRARYLDRSVFKHVRDLALVAQGGRWLTDLLSEYDAPGEHPENGGGERRWKYRLAWEAYGHHWDTRVDESNVQQVWGNALFSVTRENLGDLRYDEVYVGKGGEDLDFLMQFERQYGDSYRGFIRYEPDYNLFLFEHDRDAESWGSDTFQQINNYRYCTKRHEWWPDRFRPPALPPCMIRDEG